MSQKSYTTHMSTRATQPHAREGARTRTGSLAAVAMLATLLGSGLAVSQAVAATPGHPSCHALEMQCLARVDRLRTLISRASDPTDIHVDASDTEKDKCYDAIASARTTGIWPAEKGIPAIGCASN